MLFALFDGNKPGCRNVFGAILKRHNKIRSMPIRIKTRPFMDLPQIWHTHSLTQSMNGGKIWSWLSKVLVPMYSYGTPLPLPNRNTLGPNFATIHRLGQGVCVPNLGRIHEGTRFYSDWHTPLNSTLYKNVK